MRGESLGPSLKYPWQQAVLDALIEYPPVSDKIDAAEGAICARLCQRSTDAQEMLALRDALFALEIVFPQTKPRAESTETGEIICWADQDLI